MSTCSSCGAAIIWAITHNDKKMPLDAEPEKRAVARSKNLAGETVVSIETVWVPHWVTCPNAAQHRKAKA